MDFRYFLLRPSRVVGLAPQTNASPGSGAARAACAAVSSVAEGAMEDFEYAEGTPPTAFIIEYRDGLKAYIITLNGAASEWAVAWETAMGEKQSTTFWTQEARPYMHFTHLLKGTENMFHTGKPTWPAERTLMTSALLDALLISRSKNGIVVPTDYLNFNYKTDWDWKQPPPPPPGRPWNQQ